MIKQDKALEFYNSIYKELIKSEKPFHFEVPQGYFDKDKAKDFLENLQDFYYDNDGYVESLKLKLNPSNYCIINLNMHSYDGFPKQGKEFAYDYLVKFNKNVLLKFPYYYWNVLFKFAEIKDGEFENDYYYVGV